MTNERSSPWDGWTEAELAEVGRISIQAGRAGVSNFTLWLAKQLAKAHLRERQWDRLADLYDDEFVKRAGPTPMRKHLNSIHGRLQREREEAGNDKRF